MSRTATVGAFVAGAAAGCTLAYSLFRSRNSGGSVEEPQVKEGIDGLIGDTPLVKIRSLSEKTGCTILAKMEMSNPGGSAKDRVALAIINEAEEQGKIRPWCGDMVCEGTSGSTGISLAMLCRAKGYDCHIVVPDDTSQEKVDMLTNLGAEVHLVRPAGIVDKNQYVNYARSMAQRVNDDPDDTRRALFADQFENEANWHAHYTNTGPEIYKQTNGAVDAFVTGSGTGGTISGVGQYLKERDAGIQVVLADPPGSGLYNKVKYGVMFDAKEKEGTRKRHQVDTVVEGIGINRVTANFSAGGSHVDDAIRVSDSQALKMAKYVVDHDGFFVGSSSAVNLVATLQVAREMGPGCTIVTILCDSGTRHLSKFWKYTGDSPDDLDL